MHNEACVSLASFVLICFIDDIVYFSTNEIMTVGQNRLLCQIDMFGETFRSLVVLIF